MLRARLFALAVAAGAGTFAYLRLGRPWVLNWGATRDEATMTLPGDEVVKNAALQTTRAITIHAAPEYIWPWLVQMGPRPRAGAYTYDWIERLLGIDIQNSDQVLPEFQHLEPGATLESNGKIGIVVREVRDQEALVLFWVASNSTWTFALRPAGAATRLLSRNRIPGAGLGFWAVMAFMEAGSLVMERKMLLGIKDRAERLARERTFGREN